MPGEVDKIVVAVSIYDAEARQQSFGQVRNAFIRVVNQADGAEIARYDLSEDASTETAMIFGELYRNGAEWKFRAVGQGYSTGLARHRQRLRRQRRLTARVCLERLLHRTTAAPRPCSCETFGWSFAVTAVASSAASLLRRADGTRARRDPRRAGDLAVLRQRGRQRDRPGADEPVLAEDLPDRRRADRRVRHAAGCSRCSSSASPPSSARSRRSGSRSRAGPRRARHLRATCCTQAHPAIAAFGGMFL